MFCLPVSVRVIPPLADRESLRLHIDYKDTVALFSYQAHPVSGQHLAAVFIESSNHQNTTGKGALKVF